MVKGVKDSLSSSDFSEFFGFYPFRRRWGSRIRPHFSFTYSGVTFHVDSSKGRAGEVNLITHAHTDHHGQKNVKNEFALSSKETAKILEACCGEYRGISFDVGESVKVRGVRIRTYHTHHMHGSSAFYFDNGLLVTGDVKDYRSLPKCRVLVTEATYGFRHYVFEDEIDKLVRVERGSILGAYPIGKAQRAAEILLDAGYDVCVEGKGRIVCEKLGIEVGENGEVTITSPRELGKYRGYLGRKYILTAQEFYRYPRIVLSDHLDYEGILRMIEHCNPECVLFYHGKPGGELLEEVRGMGYEVSTLDALDVV